MQALILAGGEGTRLRPLTIYTPKPVVPIVNRPFLFYQLDLLKRAGITEITLALGYQPNKIDQIFGDGHEYGVHINYVVEPTALGTAGAYKNAFRHFKETAVIVNGDILTDVNLEAVIDYHYKKHSAATIVSTPVDNPSIYGLVQTDDNGRVIRFIEKPKEQDISCNTINAGVYVLEPQILDRIPDNEKYQFETQLFPQMVGAEAPVFGYAWSGYWIDIGTPQRYLKANQDMLNGRIGLFTGENKPFEYTNGDGERPRIDHLSAIDSGCTIKAGAEIINSVLGPNCFIEERAHIENTVLLSGTRIGKSSEVRGSIVGKSSIIGRNVKLNGAVLGDKTSLTDYTTIQQG